MLASLLGLPKLSNHMRLFLLILFGISETSAQSLGGAGTLKGTVRDASGLPAPNAIVRLSSAITGYSAQGRSGTDGAFVIGSIPPNTYSLRVLLVGFQPYNTEVTIRTGVPIQLPIRLEVAAGQTTVTVEGASATLVDSKTAASETIDRGLLAVLPTLSPTPG